jgi:2-oxo-4-hydroxy-4-carboxy-5-ureidoimidazoline decarboxylase
MADEAGAQESANKPTLAELNGMDKAAFVRVLGSIFEHSPWVAERAFEHGSRLRAS